MRRYASQRSVAISPMHDPSAILEINSRSRLRSASVKLASSAASAASLPLATSDCTVMPTGVIAGMRARRSSGTGWRITSCFASSRSSSAVKVVLSTPRSLLKPSCVRPGFSRSAVSTIQSRASLSPCCRQTASRVVRRRWAPRWNSQVRSSGVPAQTSTAAATSSITRG